MYIEELAFHGLKYEVYGDNFYKFESMSIITKHISTRQLIQDIQLRCSLRMYVRSCACMYVCMWASTSMLSI